MTDEFVRAAGGVVIRRDEEGERGNARVVYFAMRCDSRVRFVPNDEVDEVRWVDVDEARTLLTWPRDVPILERALEG